MQSCSTTTKWLPHATPLFLPNLIASTTLLYLRLYSFSISRMLDKCDHTVYNILRLAFYSPIIMPFGSIQVLAGLNRAFFPFYCSVIFHYMDVQEFVQPFTHRDTFGLQFCIMTNTIAVNIHVQDFT
jgi:hypothetical protein